MDTRSNDLHYRRYLKTQKNSLLLDIQQLQRDIEFAKKQILSKKKEVDSIDETLSTLK